MRHVICAAALALLMSCREEPTTISSSSTTTPQPGATNTSATLTAPAEICSSEAYRLCPTDEAANDPSFYRFRQQLIEAVTQRNETELLKLVDPHIRTTFGDGGGIDDFRKSLGSSSTHSALWTELAKILSLGGSFRGERENLSFWAPYIYSKWPESIDAFQHVAVVRPEVAVRADASPQASIVTTVSWAILELLPDSNRATTQEWLRVKSPDGRAGWVHVFDVHSPVGYRAGFSKRSGQWRMDAFVAGD